MGADQAMARRIVVGCSALPGLVFGHLLAYTLAYPSAEARSEHLEHTGHAAFPFLTLCAFVVIPIALALAGGWALRTRRRLPVRAVATWLAGLQILGFVGLEVTERAFALSATVTDPAVVAGVILQVPLAVCAAYLLVGFVALVRRMPGVVSLRPHHPPVPVHLRSVRSQEMLPAAPTLRRAAQRAPPAALPV